MLGNKVKSAVRLVLLALDEHWQPRQLGETPSFGNNRSDSKMAYRVSFLLGYQTAIKEGAFQPKCDLAGLRESLCQLENEDIPPRSFGIPCCAPADCSRNDDCSCRVFS